MSGIIPKKFIWNTYSCDRLRVDICQYLIVGREWLGIPKAIEIGYAMDCTII